MRANVHIVVSAECECEDNRQREQRREADRRRRRGIRQQESDVRRSQTVADLRQRATN